MVAICKAIGEAVTVAVGMATNPPDCDLVEPPTQIPDDPSVDQDCMVELVTVTNQTLSGLVSHMVGSTISTTLDSVAVEADGTVVNITVGANHSQTVSARVVSLFVTENADVSVQDHEQDTLLAITVPGANLSSTIRANGTAMIETFRTLSEDV